MSDLSKNNRIKLTENGFDKFELYRIKVDGGGNCFFHALCMAYFIPYITQKLNDKPIERIDIVRNLRRDLSLRLSAKVDPDDLNSPIVYETLGGGHMAEMGLETKEFGLDKMIKHVSSDEWCGEEIQELVSNETDKNIFFIDLRTQDIYYNSNIVSLYKKRPSIVLLYDGIHYDTCALKNKNGECITHFRFSNSFVQFLYTRLAKRTNLE